MELLAELREMVRRCAADHRDDESAVAAMMAEIEKHPRRAELRDALVENVIRNAVMAGIVEKAHSAYLERRKMWGL